MKPEATRYGRLVERRLRYEAEAERCGRKVAYWMRRWLDARKAAGRTAATLEKLEAAAEPHDPGASRGELLHEWRCALPDGHVGPCLDAAGAERP